MYFYTELDSNFNPRKHQISVPYEPRIFEVVQALKPNSRIFFFQAALPTTDCSTRQRDDDEAMPRRFPFPINVGTDICSVQRIFNIIAQKNGPYAIQFMTRILTPVEREADGASVQKHMNKWWNLQDKRRKRGLERKQYLWDAFDSHRSLRQFHGPSTGLEERGATDLELAREGSTNSLEDAARADYVADEAAHCEPSGKQAIRAPEPVDSEKPEGRAMAEATADGGAKVLGEQAEHEEVEVEADEVAAISPDEKATASGERRTHEGQDPPLEEIDKELDSTYPYMRNLAQFLAGR